MIIRSTNCGHVKIASANSQCWQCELERIQHEYVKKRFTFIDGADMKGILLYLGAKEADFARLERTSDNLAPDPTLSFRRSRNGRFCFDYNSKQIHRLEYQPFVLSPEEDFIRHDSGQLRCFRGIQDEVQLNSVFQALLRFQALVISGVKVAPRVCLEQDSPSWVSTVFHLRTITSQFELGEPALEGVHSDGVEHTMTTFAGCNNMRGDSAVSYIHANEQKTGTSHADVDPSLVLGEAQHLSYLDTLLIVDNERKHSLSPLLATDNSEQATRDMFIFFTRRPTVSGHPTNPYDSLECHREIPLTIPMEVN